MHVENIQKWIKGTNVVAFQTQKPHELQIHRWFMEILLDKGASFPLKEVSHPQADKRALFQDFIERLLFFWSGSTTLSTTKIYRIDFTPKGFPKRDVTRNTLLLPRDVTSKNELYSKLIVATFNITEGRGLYGGNR